MLHRPLEYCKKNAKSTFPIINAIFLLEEAKVETMYGEGYGMEYVIN